MVRGLLNNNRDAQQVGIITHRCHISELNKLEPCWRDRISNIDYYHSGNDRASNRWLDCDLLLVVGTPRVPPSAVREGLIQVGKIDDAAGNGKWGAYHWVGDTVEDKAVEVKALGYRDPSWQEMHGFLVRDSLLQAIGRGRGIRNSGIPVVVVSNEPLGLPFMASKRAHIGDSVAKTFTVINKLTDESPKLYNVGEMSVSTSEIAKHSVHTERSIRRHCTTLLNLGLLARKGERGGWIVVNSGQRKPMSEQ